MTKSYYSPRAPLTTASVRVVFVARCVVIRYTVCSEIQVLGSKGRLLHFAAFESPGHAKIKAKNNMLNQLKVRWVLSSANGAEDTTKTGPVGT